MHAPPLPRWERHPPPPLVRALALRRNSRAVSTVFSRLRERAEKRAAIALGIRAGIAWRYGEIDRELERRRADLDRIFDFRALMLDHGRLLPPVVEIAGAGFHLLGGAPSSSSCSSFRCPRPRGWTAWRGSVRREIDRAGSGARAARAERATLRILREARIVAAPPVWQAWLVRRYRLDARRVNPILYPRTGREIRRWKRWVREGFALGVREALELWRVHLARLRRDYDGIVTWWILWREGVVSAPREATGTPGVVVRRRTLVLGARIYRLVRESRFRAPVRWRAKPVAVPSSVVDEPPGGGGGEP